MCYGQDISDSGHCGGRAFIRPASSDQMTWYLGLGVGIVNNDQNLHFCTYNKCWPANVQFLTIISYRLIQVRSLLSLRPKRKLWAGWRCMRSTFLQILLIFSFYRLQFSCPRAYFVYMVWHCTGQYCNSIYACTYRLFASTWCPLVSVITTFLVCCKDYFSSSSVVLHTVSAICVYSKFRHHPYPLGYNCAKFRFFCDFHCCASPQRIIAYSITHPAYLMPREPKLVLRNWPTVYLYDSRNVAHVWLFVFHKIVILQPMTKFLWLTLTVLIII